MRLISEQEIKQVSGYGIYCGTAGQDWIPDDPFGYNFMAACQAHDMRYSAGSGWTRSAADAQFLSDMQAICAIDYADAFLCNLAASVYTAAVEIFGASAYQGGVSEPASPVGSFAGYNGAGAQVVYVPSDASGCIGDYFDVSGSIYGQWEAFA